ncbi:polyprenyl synthetase family protein [Agaribacterium sp. ZY112]|uniref:polyprenyl synthetase family protein n=1 Tax=Agaribacterium sp. ZY112 TaxID=3233574 RepID=UPI0035233446
MDFQEQAKHYKLRVEAQLATWFDAQAVSSSLHQAMLYSLNAGGKRVRPILVYACADICQVDTSSKSDQDCAAAAIESLHTYSLIHDDLPAMDDDDLRRGLATCHVKFDEATAILAGDALQGLAYEKLSLLDDEVLACRLIRALSSAAGAEGMVAGQMLDLEAEGQELDLSLSELECIHRNKTGALIIAAAQMGALLGGASPEQSRALATYASALGLAFQVQDDILDVVSDSETLGKTQGSDISNNKSTYVSLLGLQEAQALAKQLVEQAKQSLTVFAERGQFLSELADYITHRKN